MKLDIRTVKQRGAVDLACELDLSALKRWGETPFPEPVRVTGRVVDNGDFYEVSYTVKLSMHMPCARCLNPLRIEKELHFQHPLMEPDENASAWEEDIPLTDGILDVYDMVLGDVILETDEAVLCSPDCRGLCPVCGVDRNLAPCDCDTSLPDPRFDALRKLLDNQHDENEKTED